MDTGSYTELLNNVILLLALAVIYEVLGLTQLAHKRWREVSTGLLVGVTGVVLMLTPWELAPGIFFDTRSVLLSLCGLFFGWVPTLIAALIIGSVRVLQGGDGMMTGIAVIVSMALVGLGWRHRRAAKTASISWFELYLFGVVTHLVMLVCMLLMPSGIRWTVIQTVSLPILVIYPVATLVMGLMLQRQDQLRQLYQDIKFKNALLETEQESSGDGILTMDEQGHILSANQRFIDLWRVPEAQLAGHSVEAITQLILDQITEPETLVRQLSHLEESPRELLSTLVPLKDGRVFDLYCTPLRGEDGGSYGRMWSFRDVTERELAALELVKERNQAANILEGTHAGSWQWEIASGQLVVDARWAEMFGWTLDELLPIDITTWRSRLHPDDLPLLNEALKRHFHRITDYFDMEYRLRHKRGYWVWVNTRGKVVRWGSDGRPLQMSGTNLDISQRKQVEQDLRVSETLFRNSFKVSPVAASISGVRDGRYYEVNEAYTETFGWTEEELLSGRSVTIGLWPYKEDRDAWLEALYQHGILHNYAVKMFNKAGQLLDIQLSACLIDYTDEPCILTMLHDVTEQRHAEDEIRKREMRYRALFDSADVSIWNEDFSELYGELERLKAEGITSLRQYLVENPAAVSELTQKIKVLHVNQATLRLFEAADEGAFVGSIEHYFGENTHNVFINELCAIWERRHHFSAEVKLKTLAGRSITCVISLPLSQSEEDMRNVPVSFLDITDRVEAEQALAASQSLYSTIIHSMDQIGEGLFIVAADSRIEYMNQTMIDWFGDHTGEFCRESITGLKGVCGMESSTQKSGLGRTVQYQSATADGKYFEFVGTPIVNRDGSVSRLEVVRDVTERKRYEEQIATLSQVVEQSPVSVVITDIDGNIEYVNSAFERTTGYPSAEVVGNHTRLLQSGLTPETKYQELWAEITSGHSWQGELQSKKKSGELFWESVHIAPVLDEVGNIKNFLAVKEDITLQKVQEERILQQAHFDSLTGLPNRFLSLDRLSQLIKDASRSGRYVAVLFLDLDDFKKVNDSLGHEVGDQLLGMAAERLSSTIRDQDTVGRLGGDEFLFLLGSLVDINHSVHVAEHILEQFRRPFVLDGRELVLTASVGVAIYPDDGDTPAELLRNADTAMYYSKEAGRNTYHYFTDEMNQGVSRRLNLEEQLRGALVRNEFKVFYQPLIEIATRRIIGTEALLRWNNPKLGAVSPAEFIPIAEQTGLIVAIGEYVITVAMEQLAVWQRDHPGPMKMAVNISPRQFRDPQLVPFIQQQIEQAGIRAESLELEITEGVLLSGYTHVESALSQLNRLGVAISMDDFGTGYSSLSYLRSYPFDILKIDQSFINDITIDEGDRELVNAAIAMAHGLGLKVVAEGVETEEQLHHLISQRCDYAQGYLFSQPVTGDQIKALLNSEEIA
ncbi:EAL domain-containing protein [Sedimenticola sp.]|uniref:EAL domain-containing protein n=1 Tax=Sedimenticola sp. TaxID=1940285 RepID=UPI003D0AFA5F